MGILIKKLQPQISAFIKKTPFLKLIETPDCNTGANTVTTGPYNLLLVALVLEAPVMVAPVLLALVLLAVLKDSSTSAPSTRAPSTGAT